MKNSIAVRLALMFAAATFVGFALVGVALHQVLARELVRHQVEEAVSRLDDMAYLLQHGRAPNLAERMGEKLDAQGAIDTRIRAWTWSEDPQFRYGPELERVLAATPNTAAPQGVTLALGSPPQRMRLVARTVPRAGLRPEVRIVAGVETRSFDNTLRRFELALVVLALGGTAVGALLGGWIARIGLGPVKRLSSDARQVGPHNRALRLRLPELPRELADLGTSFNAALDRLDAAYLQLGTFNDDVAHELRTPLANLIGQTQVTLARERDAARLREVLQSNLEELERLRAIVADMLFLARAEQGVRARGLVSASLAAEVAKTVEFLDVLLDDAGMSVRIEGDATALVETSLVRRALTNLLQNAIQHSGPGTRIDVRVTAQGAGAEIAFSNPSAAIAPEQLARLFDRFYRVDAARPNSGENHGLGLSIVKAVALMHNGQVFARWGSGNITVGLTVALEA